MREKEDETKRFLQSAMDTWSVTPSTAEQNGTERRLCCVVLELKSIMIMNEFSINKKSERIE